MDTFLIAVGGVVLVIVLNLLLALPVMWCWNYVIPDVFGLPVLTFWQAAVLSALCSMLFKSSSGSIKK